MMIATEWSIEQEIPRNMLVFNKRDHKLYIYP